jgi:MFS family permease
MSQAAVHEGDRNAGALIAAVCICGPALVSLIGMAPAAALPAMAKHFNQNGDGAIIAQNILTLPSIALIIASPISGFLGERFGRRAVLLASWALYVVSGAAGLLAADALSLVVSRLVLGAAGGALLTTSLALIGDYFGGHTRERVLGFGVAFASLVAAGALTAGGALVDAFGWRAPFALYLSGLPALIAAWFVIHPPHHTRAEDKAAKAATGDWAPIVRLWPLYALLVLSTIGMYTPAIQGPFLLSEQSAMSATEQGAIIAASSIVAIFAAALYGYIRRALGLTSVLALVMASFGFGIVAMAWLPGAEKIIGSAIIGFGAGCAEATIASAILIKSPDHVHGRALGLLVSALFLGQWLNPWVFAPLRAALGLSNAFWMVGAAFVLLCAALLAYRFVRGEKLDGPARAAG